MKKIMRLAAAFSVFGLLFTACEKDKFTEEDALNSQQTIDVVVNVLDRSNNDLPLDSVVVIALINGERIEKTTDESGSITYSDVKIGASISVYLEKTNYLNAYTTVGTSTSNYRQGQVSSTVYMYSLEGGMVATVRGKITVETDLTNREREAAGGIVVRAQNTYLNDYAEQFFFDSTDVDGNYEIKVPVRTVGTNYINVVYPPFIASQSFAKELKNGTIQVVDRLVEFYSNDYNTSIGVDAVPSAYITIDAPPSEALGTGFALASSANPSMISSYSALELISGGSGFFGGADSLGAIFYFDEGVNGDTAYINVDVENGSITSINSIVNNGATYTSAPSINFTDGGSGVVIDFRFQTTYNVYVANSGSGYSVYPHVAASVNDYNGTQLVKYVDDDINDNSDNIIGANSVFDNYAMISSGGSIQADAGNGDTLFSSTPLPEPPVFEIYNEDQTERAVLSLNYYDVSASDSSIIDYDIDEYGYGYDPLNPPTVTVNTVAGMGAGAVLRAEVSTNRSLSNVEIIRGGDGYVRNVNDHRGIETTNNYEAPSYPNTNFYIANPYEVIIQDVFYGTGERVVEKEEEE